MSGRGSTGSELAPGIRRISLSTPWLVGSVNVYLVEDEPLTLVDTGQRSPSALAELEAALQALGHRVEDLQRIVVSHQHLDHCGLAQDLVDRSGAELCAWEGLADWLGTYPGSLEAEDLLAAGLLRRHGVGTHVAAADVVYRGGFEYCARATVTRPLRDGDVLEFADRRLRAYHRPGHSPSDTVFHDEQRGILFGADHLLQWPSTSFLAPPLDGSRIDGRPRPLAQYMTSLRATGAMDVELVLTGHGEPLHGHRALIAERLLRYERITKQVGELVGSEPRTAAEIATDLKGSLPDGTAFFMLCEVLGHLDELLDVGAVTEAEDADGVARFAAAP